MSQELIQEDSGTIDHRSVGLVERQSVTLFEPPHVLSPAGGGKLGPIDIVYETYGELSPQRDNAIYVCHALTGDAHAAGWHPGAEKPGWWDGFIGPGKGLDTNKYYVICANILGGCQGTTGPGSINPATGERYGRSFPFITVGDMVEVQAALVKHLGIERLLAVIGGSLGGMQVLEWAARFPDRLAAAIVLAAGARLSAQGIAFNCVGNRAISADPQFNDGDYYDKEVPRYGLALARMLAHITYLSQSSIEMKFGRRLQNGSAFAYDLLKETEFQIESYLHYQGSRFVERFDANSYLYITRAMDYFDLAESYGPLDMALGKTDARFLIAAYDTDWLFPTSQSLELVHALMAARRHVSFIELHSPFGHDSFLIELEQLSKIVSPFLTQTQQSIRL
ncbi:MAG: homoserine O-acetyltransferase [Planctomycetaceae bacterium]